MERSRDGLRASSSSLFISEPGGSGNFNCVLSGPFEARKRIRKQANKCVSVRRIEGGGRKLDVVSRPRGQLFPPACVVLPKALVGCASSVSRSRSSQKLEHLSEQKKKENAN